MKKKIKLVEFLINNYGYSEKEAMAFIMAGRVLINDKVITSPYYHIKDTDNIRIKEKKRYVSRGAYKLLTAFKHFDINVKDKITIDIGSSTGGFTEVLLQKGAKRVYAVDCGKNQIDYSLRINPKVVVIENRVIQSLVKTDFPENVEFAVMDVSFTSSIPIIEHIFLNLDIKDLIVLIKPQFEFKRYREILSLSSDFRGIVNAEDRDKIIEAVKEEILNMNLEISGVVESEIKGTKGNLEYIFYIKRK